MSVATITAAQWGLVFYAPNPTITLNITAGATAYSITDIYGATVSSGSISTSVTSFTATAPGGGWINGWYLVQVSGPSSYYGLITFQIINNDSHFKTVPAWGSAVNGSDPGSTSDDDIGLLTSAMGAYRWEVGSASSPTTDINAIKANLDFMANWVNDDSARQQVLICSFGNGATDSVTIGNLVFWRRGGQTDPASITIGAGTTSGTYKLTVTDTSSSTVVETHDNCANALAIQTAVNAQSNGWLYAFGTGSNSASASAPTQSTATLANSNTLGAIQLIQAIYNYNSIGVMWFEGPENEPSGGDPGGSAAFISIVHAANANAKALVPSLLGAQNTGMSTWVSKMQIIGVVPDGVSFHGYNLFDSADIDAEDQTLPTVINPIQSAWGSSATIFQTENGWITEVGYSLLSPYLSARQMTGILAYSEIIGIPKERFFYFYSTSHGFGGFPSWWKNGDSSLSPRWTAARGMSERLYGTTFSQRITLPSPLNRMFLAAKWTDSTYQTILIQPAGLDAANVSLSVSGASSLTVYDWAGNQSTVAVSSNTASVTISSLGAWIVAPLAAAIAITDINNGLMNLGNNQADYRKTDVQVVTSSSVVSDQMGGVSHPGVSWLNGTDPMTADRTGMGQSPWKDTSDTLPSYLTFNFSTPTRIDRAIILCPPAITEGQRNSLTQFEVQYQAPGSSSWVTAYSETNDTAVSSALAGDWVSKMGSGTHVTQLSQWNQKYHFDCPFSMPQTVQAVRIVAQETSYGASPDTASNSNGVGASLSSYFECRFVGLYCADSQISNSVLV